MEKDNFDLKSTIENLQKRGREFQKRNSMEVSLETKFDANATFLPSIQQRKESSDTIPFLQEAIDNYLNNNNNTS
jgi:hypothetical protein